MNKRIRIPLLSFSLLLTILFASCEGLFDTHPYDVDLHGEHNINATNIEKIKEICLNKDTLRFAVISDTHGWYTETSEEVSDINNRKDSVDFVIHLGDLTETGTTTEFKWARKYLSRLAVPYVALIGNHDFLGTGDQAYEWMFGKKDFSFIVGRVKFVGLNTNAMEYDRVVAVPDFEFMETEATTDTTEFDRTIMLMHAPPYSDQFNNNVSKAFGYYLKLFPNLMFCLYGHNHEDAISQFYEDVPLFYGIDCAEHRNYHIFTITPTGYEQKRIDY